MPQRCLQLPLLRKKTEHWLWLLPPGCTQHVLLSQTPPMLRDLHSIQHLQGLMQQMRWLGEVTAWRGARMLTGQARRPGRVKRLHGTGVVAAVVHGRRRHRLRCHVEHQPSGSVTPSCSADWSEPDHRSGWIAGVVYDVMLPLHFRVLGFRVQP